MKYITIKAQAGIIGFESPAAEYIDLGLDLDELLIKHPSATFFRIAQDESMSGDGIYDGDLLIVSRAEETIHYDILVASLNGETVCRRLDKHKKTLLCSESWHSPYVLQEADEFCVEGVVTSSVRLHQKLAFKFTSPTAEYLELGEDLDALIVRKPSASFFGLAQGESMTGDGIFNGDLLIISRAEEATHYDIIVASLNGEFVCKRLDIRKKALLSSGQGRSPYILKNTDEFRIEGVVICSIRLHKKLARFN